MILFRVGHVISKKGFWYDRDGSFAGRIHKEYSSFKNSSLEMPYDEECVGYLSACDSFEKLLEWFPLEDIEKAYKDGYRVLWYEVPEEEAKWANKFNHWLIPEHIQPKISINNLDLLRREAA